MDAGSRIVNFIRDGTVFAELWNIYTTLVCMRSSNAWTMKPWQRSEWRLGFNSVLECNWAPPWVASGSYLRLNHGCTDWWCLGRTRHHGSHKPVESRTQFIRCKQKFKVAYFKYFRVGIVILWPLALSSKSLWHRRQFLSSQNPDATILSELCFFLLCCKALQIHTYVLKKTFPDYNYKIVTLKLYKHYK